MSDYTLGDTIYHAFTTRAFATGVPTALAGSPTVEIYENDSTSPIVEGASKLVLTQNLNSINGFNLVTITATTGNGFEAGKTYHTILKTGTVGGTSVVGEVVFRFTLQASAAAADLANGTDGLGAIKTDTAAILVDTGTTLDGRIPAALVGGRMDSSVGAIATGAIAAASFAAGAIDAAAIAANAIGASELAADAATEIADAILTRQMTEAYAANGVAPTLAQAQFAMHQMLMQFIISGTTYTVRKLDNSTTAFVVTLDSATAPTSAVRT